VGGGRLGDLALAGNSGSLFTCIALNGNSVFLSGRSAIQYQCSPAGAIKMDTANPTWVFLDQPAVGDMFMGLIQQSSSDPFENEYAKVVQRSITSEALVSAGMAGVTINTVFPSSNNLADQLKAVARLIGARQSLGAKRQVFMVSIGGFDLHDGLAARQPVLLQQVSDVITAFYNATVELGIASNVTTFTASDFGRTLTVNGDGSDHGWGSHHFVVGGAVKGAGFYGTPPPISVGDTQAPEDQWHVGQGRLLPSTSVDQYAATLARWFGVADSELNAVLPNLKNFGAGAGFPNYPTNLGFFR
jgi:uncharacterized protein (DUF1501 family)